jgi:hypothetical protein
VVNHALATRKDVTIDITERLQRTGRAFRVGSISPRNAGIIVEYSRKPPPNTACTGQLGFAPFFGVGPELLQFSVSELYPHQPPVLITAVVKCRERTVFFRAFPVTPDRKHNLPIEIQLSWQIFSFFRMTFFVFWECFAIPVSLPFVPGFRDLSYVDQNDR